MKKCCTCKVVKDFTEFYKQKNQKDGHGRQCKRCKKESVNVEKRKERLKRFRVNNPEKSKESSEGWRERNKDYHKDYYQKNKKDLLEKQRDYNREYKNKKYQTDEVFRTLCKIRVQVGTYLKGKTKNKQTQDLLGYSVKDFLNVHGPGAVNQDLDHKIPMSWFKHTAPPSIVWHLDNLQWLHLSENRIKSNHHMTPVNESYLKKALPFIKEEYISSIVS